MTARGDLPARTLVWQPRASAHAATVACKATFSLTEGELTLAKAQEDIWEYDAHWDDDPRRSLNAASDLAPMKPRAEFVVVGHAYAPDARPASVFVSRITVGKEEKAVELHAERVVDQDGTITEGAPIAKLRLVYERAAGGPGTWNPAGVAGSARDAYGRKILPNVVAVGRGGKLAGLEPIGLGPIAPSWPIRSERAGLYAPHFAGGQWQKQPLPDGFDPAYFNVAPPDQQLAEIPPDVAIILEGLHPKIAVLRTKLPGYSVRATLERRGSGVPIQMRPDTLWFDTDRSICTLTWRGQVPLEHAGEEPLVIVELDRGGTSAGAAPPASRRSSNDDATRPNIPMSGASARPGRTAPGDDATRPNIDLRKFAKPKPRGGLPFDEETHTTEGGLGHEITGALPFAPAHQPSAPPPASSTGGGLPFASAAGTSPRPVHETIRQAASPWAAMVRPAPTAPAPTPAFGPPPALAPGFGPPSAPPIAPPAAVAPPPVPAAAPPSGATFGQMGFQPTSPVGVMPNAPAPGATFGQMGFQKPAATPWVPPTGPGPIAPPAAVPGHASNAAKAGITGASNAAADPGALAGSAESAAFSGDVMELLWSATGIGPRIRRRAEWKKVLDAADAAGKGKTRGGEDESPEANDARDVFEILANAIPSGEEGVQSALVSAVRSDGRFAPQLLVMAGEARLEFDELETLKAMVAAATPLAPTEGELKSSVDDGAKFLATPHLVASPEVADRLTQRIREAFVKAPPSEGPGYLDEQTERALLQKRAYQTRDVLGAKHLRTLFYSREGKTGIPTYLPESVAKKLPALRRVRMKLMAEPHFQVDQYESHKSALMAAAVARIIRSG